MVFHESLLNCSIAMEHKEIQSIPVSHSMPGILVAVSRLDIFAPLLYSSFTDSIRERPCSGPESYLSRITEKGVAQD